MIDEPKAGGFVCGVNGKFMVDFDNGDTFLQFRSFSTFALSNALSREFTNFLPCS